MDLSANLAIGGAVALRNVASSLAHDYVLGMLPGSDPASVEWQAAILGPALTGGATLLAANLTIGSITGMRPAPRAGGHRRRQPRVGQLRLQCCLSEHVRKSDRLCDLLIRRI